MKYGKWLLSGLAVCFCAFGDGGEKHSPLIRVHADRNAGRAPEMIYGQNIEAADTRGIFTSLKNPAPPEIVNNASGYWDASGNRPVPIALETIRQLRCRMLRYPGGCLAHNYDWRKTVGPLEQRSQWKFGLDEFLRLCRETGAEPLITLTDYLLPAEKLPQHLAELVEYLNAPARPEFPQAMKRAANGHPEPYGVKYFEIGNETYHPNHNLLPARRFSVQQYIRYARNVIKALRSVDPSVRLGVVGYGLGLGEEPNPWDGAIYRELGNEADFIVHHLYVPKLDGLSPREAEAVIATSGEVIRQRLLNCRRHMRKLAGRELPIAVTEFNASGTRNAPHAWRFSYAAGINLCEFLMEMRKPEHNILMASYWQTVGGYFGMLQVDKNGGGKFNAVWPFFRAFTEYTAPDLLVTEIADNPRGDFRAAKAGQISAGGDRFIPARKLGAVRKLYFYFSELGKANVSGEGDLRRLSFRFRNCSRNSYPSFLTIPVPEEVKGGSFSVNAEFEARFIPDSGSSGSVSLGFGLMDSRGYAATRLAQAVSGLEKAGEWTRFACPALGVGPDTPSLTGLLRLEKVTGEFSGTLEIRNLQFTCSGEAMIPAVPRLAAEASRRDGTVCLAVINRSSEAMRGVRIELAGMGTGENVGKVRELFRSNIAETEPFPIVEKELPLLKENAFSWDFPPFSATFFEFKKKTAGQREAMKFSELPGRTRLAEYWRRHPVRGRFPAASDRASWEKLRQGKFQREKLALWLGTAEAMKRQAAGQPLYPEIPASAAFAFIRSGDRRSFEKPYFERRSILAVLTLAECAEYKGRFLPEIIEGIWRILGEPYWYLPAHGEYRGNDPMPLYDRPVADLFSCDTGALLATVSLLLGEEIARESPELLHWMRETVLSRVVAVFERGDSWWLEGRNNWTPWCSWNLLTIGSAFLADEPERLAAITARLLQANDLFFDNYPEDGGCDEGPGYYQNAGLKLALFLELLDFQTGGGCAEVFKQPKMRNMIEYFFKVNLTGNRFADISDTPGVIDAFHRGSLYRAAELAGSRQMCGFVLNLEEKTPENPGRAFINRELAEMLGDLFWTPLRHDPAPVERTSFTALPDLQFFVLRESVRNDRNGLILSIKGGHNAENHNHNDLGQFELFHNGTPRIVDPGRGVYTRETFSQERFNSWILNATGHNAPFFNGIGQQVGGQYRAAVDRAAPEEVTLNLTGAYMAEAGLISYRRSAGRQSGSFHIRDRVKFRTPGRNTVKLHLYTAVEPVPAAGGIRLGDDLTMEYRGLEVESIAELPLEDAILRRSWGRLWRIVFTGVFPQEGEWEFRWKSETLH